MLVEWLLVMVAFALGVRLLGARDRYAATVLTSMTLAGAALAAATSSVREPMLVQPVTIGSMAFATSSNCRSCHPTEYASWHASYHRRMTQTAELSAVASPTLRQGGRLHAETTGRTVELFSRKGELWARLPDPGVTAAASADAYEASFRNAPLRDVQVKLLTGSHHHQAFWAAGARPGELRALPVVYEIAERRLIARRDAFLNPPDAPEQSVRWNSNCVQCHAVAGQPAHDEITDTFATSVAELGIACEACHGQGAGHVRAMQNPLTRYAAHGGRKTELAIVNPQTLPSERASQICGRCHSYFFPKREADWWQHGFAESYAPGDDLAHAQLLLSPEVLARAGAPEVGATADSLFYRDGTIRVAGREYNGLVRSACFERGQGARKLGCLSCHSLHRGAPDDQLEPVKLGNQACAQCHEREATNVTEHTHHLPSSSGSLCYNCHMPHVSYALLGAIRSHRVDSPSFDADRRDRPNACSLCHLEQTEAWAAEQASRWYGQPLPSSPSIFPPVTAPAGAVFALTGDAAVRAVTAAALGRHESSHDEPALRTQLLKQLAHDDYAAVRAIAERSLRASPPTTEGEPLPSALVNQLLSARDRRPVTIAE